MSQPAEKPSYPPGYSPAKVWTQDTSKDGGTFGNINRPIAGPTHEKDLPVGRHPIQLYSMGTPNGVKVTIMLEELLALGYSGAEYDAWLINISKGEQFSSGFVDINPNSKIPCMQDRSEDLEGQHVRVFESGSMLYYLSEKFGGEFVPKDLIGRTECRNWVFWLMGSAPYLGGGFGHFYSYAPIMIEYAIDRFSMEAKRQLSVLERRLTESPYLAGEEYSIADMAVWPWYGILVQGKIYNAGEFLSVHEYPHVLAWADKIALRPAVQRGKIVNKFWGETSEQLLERHESSDFDTNTYDKLLAAATPAP
jgi:GST-like protein